MPTSSGAASEAEVDSTEKQAPAHPGQRLRGGDGERRACRSVSTSSQSAKTCCTRGSIAPVELAARPGDPDADRADRVDRPTGSAHWKRPSRGPDDRRRRRCRRARRRGCRPASCRRPRRVTTTVRSGRPAVVEGVERGEPAVLGGRGARRELRRGPSGPAPARTRPRRSGVRTGRAAGRPPQPARAASAERRAGRPGQRARGPTVQGSGTHDSILTALPAMIMRFSARHAVGVSRAAIRWRRVTRWCPAPAGCWDRAVGRVAGRR